MIGQLFATPGSSSRILYFFCEFDNDESLCASTILSSLVRQCLDAQSLPQSIESRLANLLQVSSSEAKELGVLLRDVLQVAAKAIFIFIDAIHECKKFERSILLKVLQDLKISCSSKVKIFLAVRQGIVEEVEKMCKPCCQATMSCIEANLNIMTYIGDILTERKESGALVVGNRKLLDEIKDALVQEADGMLVSLFTL